jgi:hypothetical protein
MRNHHQRWLLPDNTAQPVGPGLSQRKCTVHLCIQRKRSQPLKIVGICLYSYAVLMGRVLLYAQKQRVDMEDLSCSDCHGKI